MKVSNHDSTEEFTIRAQRVIGALALHRQLRTWSREQCWTITHRRTGLAVAHIGPGVRRSDVIPLLERLSKLEPWDFDEKEDVTPALGLEVGRVVRSEGLRSSYPTFDVGDVVKGLLPAGPARERPILFSPTMAQAVHEGTKTQTRRVMKPQPSDDYSVLEVGLYHPTLVDRHGEEYPGAGRFGAWTLDGEHGWPCPYGNPGERLWVRETWYCDDYRVQAGPYKAQDDWTTEQRDGLLYYKGRDDAGNGLTNTGFSLETMRSPWRPSIHMPRDFCRTLLELTDVRVERAQEIDREGALDEGIYENVAGFHWKTPAPTLGYHGTQHAFADLWDSINGKREGCSWASNPWVWVLGLKRVEAEEAA